MSYQVGLNPALAAMLKTKPCEPHIYCDGCGRKRSVINERRMGPYAWFLDGKPPPGWTGKRTDPPENGKEWSTREDWCPECRSKKAKGKK